MKITLINKKLLDEGSYFLRIVSKSNPSIGLEEVNVSHKEKVEVSDDFILEDIYSKLELAHKFINFGLAKKFYNAKR